ncbi:TPA: YopX family protein [Streptococcus agalactiae]
MIPKFRAWSKKFKRMYKVTIIDYENGDVGLKDEHGGVAIGDIKQFILMQSTGMFDENGVEIFEEDVVRHIDLGLNCESIGKVYFKDGSFMYGVVVDKYIYDVPIGRIMENSIIEVVGNIYENPELLERLEG